MTENIKASEELYISTVNKINSMYDEMRDEIKNIVISLSHNEESRISFSRKSLASSVKILEDFTSFYDPTVDKKIEESLKKNEEEKLDSVLKVL